MGKTTHLLFMDDLKVFAETKRRSRGRSMRQVKGPRIGVRAGEVYSGAYQGGEVGGRGGSTILCVQYGDTYGYLEHPHQS